MHATTSTSHIATVVERLEQAGCVVVVVSSAIVPGADWKREREGIALQAMANIVICVRVDGTALDITKEIVQGFDRTSSSVYAL